MSHAQDPMSPELPTIDLQTLEEVTGGVTAAATDPNSAVVTMLQDLLSSIQQLAQNHQSSGGMSQMMPMMMGMGQHKAAPAAPEVPVGTQTPAGWTRVS
jgi:hypothetical protein